MIPIVIKTPKWVICLFFGHNLSLIWPGNLISVSSYMFSGMENRMGAISKPSDNRVARICISQCPYLCFWIPGIDWKNFWDPPINRVARSSKQCCQIYKYWHTSPQRWFIAWLNDAQPAFISTIALSPMLAIALR